MDGFSPIPGKCFYWRERLNQEDRFDTRLKKAQWRVECTCFVEGDLWTFTVDEVPSNCPQRYHCRYYIQSG